MKLRLFQAIAEALPWARKARVSNRYETPNASGSATVSSIQSAIRAAEGGDTRELFALYRDLTAGGSHIQAELNKRKLALLAQPMALLPADKEDEDDMAAAAALTQMVADCENWNDGLTHLLDSALWPVAVCEKIFRPVVAGEKAAELGLQYTLKRLVVVNPTVLCFREPTGVGGQRNGRNGKNGTDGSNGEDVWEPDLRFWATDGEGRIIWNQEQAYGADPERHLVHRGHLLVGMRDNWGGPMRSVVFWWLLSTLGRDWFARAMERYGVPFPVGHTDGKDAAAVTFLETAFSQATKIGGLVVDHETQVELKEIALSGLADAHEKFLSVCNREISKVIVGQTLSAEAQPTGLGSGTLQLQGEVREDIRMFDQMKLGETLRLGLFMQCLRVNGLKGNAPKAVWGGLSDADAKLFADLLSTLSQAGFEPTDEALPTMSERLGMPVQRKATSVAAIGGQGTGGNGMDGSARQNGPGDGTTGNGNDGADGTKVEGFRASRLIVLGSGGDRVLPTDLVAMERAKALGEAYRGSMAPFRQIILSSSSREECLAKLQAAYIDWKPERLAAELDTALQICAATAKS